MSSLRDQLLKAGAISDKQAKKAKHEADAQQRKAKKSGNQTESAALAEEVKKRAEEKRQADLKLNKETIAAQKEREKRAQITQIIESNRLSAGVERFHFLFGEKRVAHVEVATEVAQMLCSGTAVILKNIEEEPEFVVVSSDAAKRLVSLGFGTVLFHNS